MGLILRSSDTTKRENTTHVEGHGTNTTSYRRRGSDHCYASFLLNDTQTSSVTGLKMNRFDFLFRGPSVAPSADSPHRRSQMRAADRFNSRWLPLLPRENASGIYYTVFTIVPLCWLQPY